MNDFMSEKKPELHEEKDLSFPPYASSFPLWTLLCRNFVFGAVLAMR